MLTMDWWKWLVLGCALIVPPIDCDEASADVQTCIKKCPFQNRTGYTGDTGDGHFDLSCGYQCSVQQCTLGCGVWLEALNSSCQTVCNVTSETVVSRELYCVIGCNEALNTYFQRLRGVLVSAALSPRSSDAAALLPATSLFGMFGWIFQHQWVPEELGVVPAPALVADSVTATSLELTWERGGVSAVSAGLPARLQWRYEEPADAAWQYHTHHTLENSSTILVDDLAPYTKYRFRVAILLWERGAVEPVYSLPSVVMLTAGRGLPASPPARLSAATTAASPHRLAVSWQRGHTVNGPLVAYVLRLTDTNTLQHSNLDSVVLELPASNSSLSYMFHNLVAGRSYTVSVAMRNEEGEGPRASLTVTMPRRTQESSETADTQATLIVRVTHGVLAIPTADMLAEPTQLFSSPLEVTGMGVDVASELLFVSVSDGAVYQSSLTTPSTPRVVIPPQPSRPRALSVDWLNKRLYTLGRDGSSWEIEHCAYDGTDHREVTRLDVQPIHFEVDPYNGYMWYTVGGAERGGLYRVELECDGCDGVGGARMIVRDAWLGAFAVEHAEYRVLVAHSRRNTVLAVSLDGGSVTDFRAHTQRPLFRWAVSLAWSGALFYWTDGDQMLGEEHHATTQAYFHNEYPLYSRGDKAKPTQVVVALRRSQPMPVPVNPPMTVYAILGIRRANVSWSPPPLLGVQGAGAWQHWRYSLRLTRNDTGETIVRGNISGTTFLVEELQPAIEYTVHVAAYSDAGTGPWSSEWVGTTLADSESCVQSRIVWWGRRGLLRADLEGRGEELLVDRSMMLDAEVRELSWYRGRVVMVTNDSVVWVDAGSRARAVVAQLDGVGGLCVDWVGSRLYWANPTQQLISRGNLDGSHREPVPIVTVGKQLAIDAVEAYLYWSTGHGVEASRLSGERRLLYYPAQLFSGRQVMGITLDLEQRWVYWTVRSVDGSELHRAPTADRIPEYAEVGGTLVGGLGGLGGATAGPLAAFGGRLLWAGGGAGGGGDVAMLADTRGQYAAPLLHDVTLLIVTNPVLHARYENAVAIPESIDPESISVAGEWDDFTVKWARAERVNLNNSRLRYRVSVRAADHVHLERTVEQPVLRVRSSGLPAYSPLEVVVSAESAWGAGGAARVTRHSPAATPSEPTDPRLFVQTTPSGSVSAIFRWRAPLSPRGALQRYEARCWAESEGRAGGVGGNTSACADAALSPAHTQLELTDLAPNTTYYFQVRARTLAGFGPYSVAVWSRGDAVRPVPRVLVSTADALRVLDLDNGDVHSAPKSTGLPVDVAAMLTEGAAYWANNLMELFQASIHSSHHYKLLSMNGSCESVSAEWVGRAVYWAQRDGAADRHVVLRARLAPTATITATATSVSVATLITRPRPVLSLQVSPAHGSLYWYEGYSSLGLGVLMTAKLDGSNVRGFFNSSSRTEKTCNCSENPDVANTFVLDMTGNESELYWVDPWLHKIVATDMSGCRCRQVVDATPKKKYGFSPTSIAVDSQYLYWFNATDRAIYYTNKIGKANIEQVKGSNLANGYKILALDPRTQPSPPTHCLFVSQLKLEPVVSSRKADSITISLPSVEKPPQCSDIEYEMSMTEYTIMYKAYEVAESSDCGKESCEVLTTTDEEVTLRGLRPLTNYSVVVEVTNFYMRRHHQPPVRGLTAVLATAAQAPSAPREVAVTVLSPESARVSWRAEPANTYELHWRTEHARPLTEHNTLVVAHGGVALIPRLSPDTTYEVWVRARSPHSASAVWADSAPRRLRTPRLPPAPALHRRGPHQIMLRWRPLTDVHSFRVEYTEAGSASGTWRACSNNGTDWLAGELRPRTRYRFRVRTQYASAATAPPYYWPADDRFTYETEGSVPGAAGAVQAEALGDGALRTWWAEPRPNGHPLTAYRVWGRPLHPSSEEQNKTQHSDNSLSELLKDVDDESRKIILEEGLQLLHNGTEPYWVVSARELGGGWWLRAQGYNTRGWGPLGDAGRAGGGASLAPLPASPPPALLAAAVAALVALLLATAALTLCMYRRRADKKSGGAVVLRRRGPDVELAALRELPTRHSTNILYNQTAACMADVEVSSLPHIAREQITLTRFLGAGAFGEVFQGVARGLDAGEKETRVAVKTLKKGATEQEKCEFLKEAALMSNFKHAHILRLIGVCVDNDPHYIVMELMEQGDLLSYLRAERAKLSTPQSLTLRDLLSMCVDVTSGCRYLEEMHFVHRDLAARNCLVSHTPRGRVVKIGDFGLARDIYKNDYYRKEGEGLLPVRWMAVECLVDGVFSCQSDVWAWAVLCWEILSLGQQPYPGLGNREVVAFVRAGGTLTPPPTAPQPLCSLLSRCWSYAAETRPTFRVCLDLVTSLRDSHPAPDPADIAPAPTSATPHNYLQLLPDDAVENRTYLLDENDNACRDGDIPATSRSVQPRASWSPGGSYSVDGYEVPIAPLQPAWSRHSIVGVAPRALLHRPPIARALSLRTPRPHRATVTPRGHHQRASVCDVLPTLADLDSTAQDHKTSF